MGNFETANLTYLKWTELYNKEKPYQIFSSFHLPEDLPASNLHFESEAEDKIYNVRGEEERHSLDDHGFQFLSHPSVVTKFDSPSEIEQKYLPEVEALIRAQMKDVGYVYMFDWRIRRNVEGMKKGEVINLSDKMQHLLPATQIHVDTAASSVAYRVEKELGQHADVLFQGRVQVINVWRPILHPIEDMPLALCDGATIQDSDIVICDHITGSYSAETTYLLRNKRHRWYFWGNQAEDEVILFKNFDSSDQVKATCSPHTSFKQHNIRPGAPPRESIEVRAMVFSANI